MRVYARIFLNMLVYAFMRYMLIQNKYKLCFYTFLLTLLVILILNFYFEKYAFMLVFPSLLMTRLSVALWRGNSHMIRALRAPPTLAGDERGDLAELGSGSDDDMDFSSEKIGDERHEQRECVLLTLTSNVLEFLTLLTVHK